MKLKSYINLTRDTKLKQTVQIRLAADAAPASPFVLLGDIIHEPVDDNLSGAQLTDVSHVIFQHVQEQVYLKHQLQDMGLINITNGGTFKLVERVFVDQGKNRLGYNEEATIKVTVSPADATHDAITFKVSNPDLVTVTSDTGNGTFKFRGPSKGEFFVTVRMNGFEQVIPYEISEEELAVVLPVPVASVTVAPTTKSLVVAATQQLTPTVLPANATNKAVTYTSSDATKATVSASGLITAVAAGTATITAKTTDGNKTATCVVTVTAA